LVNNDKIFNNMIKSVNLTNQKLNKNQINTKSMYLNENNQIKVIEHNPFIFKFIIFERFIFSISWVNFNPKNKFDDDYNKLIQVEESDLLLKEKLDMFMKVYEFYLTINQYDKIMIYLVMSWKIVYSMIRTSI